MKNIIALTLVFAAITNTVQAFDRIWTAARVGDRMISSYDVGEYIEQYILSDRVKATLFEAAEGDYDLYQKQIKDIKDKLFVDTLDRMIYQRYIETIALIGQSGRRTLFNTTDRQFNETFQRELKKHTEKFSKEKDPARALGAFLQENNYPHPKGESTLNTFQRWEAVLRYRVKEDFRVTNVNNAEYALALKSYPRAYENPDKDYIAPSRYIEKHQNGWKKINGQTFPIASSAKHMADLDGIVVSDLKRLSIHSSMNDLAKETTFVNQQLGLISSALSQKTLRRPLENLDDYIALAAKLAQDEDTDSLEAQKKKLLDEYIAGGSKGSLVSARVLDLAIGISEGSAEIGNISSAKILATLNDKNKLSKMASASAKESTLVEAVIAGIIPNHKNAAYERESDLAREVLKSVLAEIGKDSHVKIKVTLKKDISSDEYKVIQTKVKNEFVAKAISHFRKSGDLHSKSYLITRNRDGDHSERGENVVESIIP